MPSNTCSSDRKMKKRTFRALWHVRINAARSLGTTGSRFMEGLKAAKVGLDRKSARRHRRTDFAAFGELVKVV